MATKDLARTPLEAGHYNGKNQRRRGKNHAPRNTARQQERQKLDSYVDEDSDTHVDEPTEYTRNSDKLGAVKRWVLSQCGRPWDKVFSEISEKFDFKTMAGRHILLHIKGYIEFGYDHELYSRWSREKREFPSSWTPAYVNAAGILLKNRNYRRQPWKNKHKKEREAAQKFRNAVQAWAKGRAIGSEGALLFWHSALEEQVKVWCELPSCYRKHFHDEKLIRECDHFEGSRSSYRYHLEKRIKFTRLGKLTPEDMKFYFSLPDDFKPGVTSLIQNTRRYGKSKGRRS